MARTFRLLKTVPTLGNLADEDGEDSFSSQFFEWLNSATGKDVIANVTNIASHEAGVQPVYRTPTGVYANPAPAINPTLLLAGVALLAVLLVRK